MVKALKPTLGKTWTAHYLNAYNPLVDALKKCVEGMPHNPAQDEAVELLKKLGEWE